MKESIHINTEREHIFSPDIHVGIAAKINKRIDKDKIYNAIKLLQHRHPLLTATITFEENNAAYYKLDSAKPIQPDFMEIDNTLCWREWMEGINCQPFDFQNGPLIKILVINSKRHTTIAALGHHLLGDGISFVYFMRDFLAALDNKLDDTQLIPPIIQNASYLPLGGRLRFLPKLLAKKLNSDYRKTGKTFTYEEYHAIYNNYNYNKKPAICLFSFNIKETQELIDKCHLQHVTVNEAITTAFLAARMKAGNKSDYVGVSCNIRSEMLKDPKDSMGNFVSGISISAQYDFALSFWANTRKIGELLNKKLRTPRTRMIALSFLDALDDSLIDAINFVGFSGNENKVAEKLCDIVCGIPNDKGLGISNLGKFQIEFDQFLVDEMWFVPPLLASIDFVVGVVTINNKMRFCLRYASTDIDEEAVKKLFITAKSMLFSE